MRSAQLGVTSLRKSARRIFQDVIDNPLEIVGPADGQITLESDSIESGKNPVDEGAETCLERGLFPHGIRLWNDCVVTIILGVRMPVFFLILVGGWSHVKIIEPEAFITCPKISESNSFPKDWFSPFHIDGNSSFMPLSI
jgi:hypothetical protein